MHTLVVEPLTAILGPAPHDVHLPGPGKGLYVPVLHNNHVAVPLAPVDTALQAHTFDTEPVTAENFRAPHPVHAADPGSVLYVPKAQNVHAAEPVGPVNPALQAHTFGTEPVTAENFPDPHNDTIW